jgi:hypothetical protein
LFGRASAYRQTATATNAIGELLEVAMMSCDAG